jgi:uncharacterized metal-binding protein YceD (DUF177 family)
MTDHLPLSRPIDVASIPPGGTARQVIASETEREALAKALDILEVKSLDAELSIAPWRTEGISVTGRLRARVVQSCVVSLVPVEQEIDEPIDARFVPAGSKLAATTDAYGHAVALDPGDMDAPEVFTGHSVDLGALVAEHLSLALDPYPRAPGAEMPPEFREREPERDTADSPFAVLEKLKNKGGIKG